MLFSDSDTSYLRKDSNSLSFNLLKGISFSKYFKQKKVSFVFSWKNLLFSTNIITFYMAP